MPTATKPKTMIERWRKNKVSTRVTKHLEGTEHDHDQSTHGRKGLGVATEPILEGAHPVRARIRQWDRDFASDFERGLWNKTGSEVSTRTDQGIARVGELMRLDPRWETAETEWDNLDQHTEEVIDTIYQQAEDLTSRYHVLAGDMGGHYITDYQGVDLWALEQHFDQQVIPQGADADDYPVGGFGFEQLESLQVGDVVNTTESITKPSDTYGEVFENDRWSVISIDRDFGKVRLERLSSDDFFGEKSGFGDPETLGPLLGGKGSAMGPEHKTVGLETLYLDDVDDQFIVVSQFEYADIEGEFSQDIGSLRSSWDDFEQAFGVDPDTAYSYIELGDYSVFSNVDSAGETKGLVVNDSYGGSGTTIVTEVDQVPMALRNLWANTAADEHRWALAMQMAVRDEFELNALPFDDLIGRSASVIGDAKETYGGYETGLRVYARAVYDMTQEYLYSDENPFFLSSGLAAISEGTLPLQRGMSLTQEIYDEHYSDVPIKEFGQAGFEPVLLTLNPLSSWSASNSTAASFKGRKAVTSFSSITRAFVPNEQIWGISTLGNGAYSEQEVIVLGGDDSVTGEIRITR